MNEKIQKFINFLKNKQDNIIEKYDLSFNDVFEVLNYGIEKTSEFSRYNNYILLCTRDFIFYNNDIPKPDIDEIINALEYIKGKDNVQEGGRK